jgi:uncharacterized protein (DUF305 family)
MITSLRSAAVVLIALTLTWSACGGGSDATSSDPGATGGISSIPADADFNEADVEFAQNMIPHHTQAVQMAQLALAAEAGAGEEIKAVAAQIAGAQEPEIALMTGWLQAWGQPLDMAGMEGMEEMDGMEQMEGMLSADELATLSSQSGPAFDVAFAEAMIVHHQSAIAQAETVKASGLNPDVRSLADEIISAQQAEITQLEALSAG